MYFSQILAPVSLLLCPLVHLTERVAISIYIYMIVPIPCIHSSLNAPIPRESLIPSNVKSQSLSITNNCNMCTEL